MIKCSKVTLRKIFPNKVKSTGHKWRESHSCCCCLLDLDVSSIILSYSEITVFSSLISSLIRFFLRSMFLWYSETSMSCSSFIFLWEVFVKMKCLTTSLSISRLIVCCSMIKSRWSFLSCLVSFNKLVIFFMLSIAAQLFSIRIRNKWEIKSKL